MTKLMENDNHTENQKVVAQVNDVAEAVERMTGIPVSQMGASDIERLKDMKSRLEAHVIGQDKAVEAVSKAIRRNRAGFDEGNRPIGSFLFVGPTGVGKTELAKQLALDMFGNKDAIIRLDMSEYSDRTAVSKLIGATAGYVGYEDNSNTLTERVRRNPYSIVLFDEIEKAHPDVFNVLLQVLDDGRVTDSQGRTVDFKNTILIMTSNIGATYLLDGIDQDGNIKPEAEEMVMNDLRAHFRPEFLNRLDETILFKPLTKDNIGGIIKLIIADLNKRLADRELTVELSDAAEHFIIEEAYDPVYGARPLKRYIQKYVETLSAKLILEDKVDQGDIIYIDVDGDHLTAGVRKP